MILSPIDGMSTETESLSRENLYERHNLSSPGRKFIAYILPIFEWSVDFGEELEADTHEEVLAEIALWKAFDDEPTLTPFVRLTVLLLIFDYLHHLPFVVYGMLIVGLATLSGLASGLGGSRLLAAEFAGKTDEDGIPASLLVRATNIASSTVTLVFLSIGLGIQLIATLEADRVELVGQNIMSSGPLPPLGTVFLLTVALFIYSLYRN